MSAPRIVLASTSRYRADLLRRLVEDFEQVAPAVDEQPLPGEMPAKRARRLAAAKASSMSAGDALVIGSDQVASLDGGILHKPGNIENAREQLRASSGRCVDFFTGVCISNSRDRRSWEALDHTRVFFRELQEAEIDRYLAREQAFDCAGSFKSEGAGIALFERIEAEDPTALVGLPLMSLARLLRQAGYAVP